MESTDEAKKQILIARLLKKIDTVKTADKQISILDIIMDFSTENAIELEYISEAINADIYFKELFEMDCKANLILKSNKKREVQW